VPVIGVIEPGAREALSATQSGRIGVIGTNATISSRAYENQIHRLAEREYLDKRRGIKVFSQSCPLFVPLAEEGWLSGSVTRQTAERYLSFFKKNKVDTLILGCTHYPLLKSIIGSVLGRGVRLVDSARQCAVEVEKVLYNEGLLGDSRAKGTLRFFVSDEPQRFAVLGRRFLGSNIKCTRRIDEF
jgi:glutamate racemase